MKHLEKKIEIIEKNSEFAFDFRLPVAQLSDNELEKIYGGTAQHLYKVSKKY